MQLLYKNCWRNSVTTLLACIRTGLNNSVACIKLKNLSPLMLKRMAPGINGGGRPTGTVPKVKSHQETLREYGGTPRRDYSHFSHMSNNLVSSMYSVWLLYKQSYYYYLWNCVKSCAPCNYIIHVVHKYHKSKQNTPHDSVIYSVIQQSKSFVSVRYVNKSVTSIWQEFLNFACCLFTVEKIFFLTLVSLWHNISYWWPYWIHSLCLTKSIDSFWHA